MEEHNLEEQNNNTENSYRGKRKAAIALFVVSTIMLALFTFITAYLLWSKSGSALGFLFLVMIFGRAVYVVFAITLLFGLIGLAVAFIGRPKGSKLFLLNLAQVAATIIVLVVYEVMIRA